jgi:phospholipid-binding lipoprotein MlaA
MKTKLLCMAVLASTAGFAQAQASGGDAPRSNDPLEPYNRAMFGFNEALDSALLAPLARGYVNVVPELVRTGVTNVLGNFGDVWSAFNQMLQGKGEAAATMTARVATNTLFGLGGLFDVASDLGMERQSEDFGQTLGRWGLPAGAYFVWPVLGPSTIRDTAGRPLDLAWSPTRLTDHELTRYSISGLQLLDARAGLLGASRVVDGIALDKYTFIRDAYIARRRSLVYDGDPPEEPADPEPAPK